MRRPSQILTSATLAVAALLLLGSSAHAAPPTITETTFSKVTTDSALLEATINPGEKSTPYHFEYGTTDCETGPCKAVPSPDASAGNGTAPLKVSFPLTGLSPGTTYHFRLLAKNSESPLNPETNEREYIKGPEATFTTHALPPTFGPCPNDQFRQGLPSETLPDCRAYEQATPIAKNAGEATSVPWLQAAADDGDAVTFLSDAGFPNAEGAQDMPLYLATRNASGWSSQGVLPSGTLAHHDARILGWLPDLSEVFSLGRNQGSPVTTSFLSRPGSGPGMRTIAPFTPKVQYAYADSSADGRLVLFEEVAQTAEGNGTSTLWLWDRTTDARTEVSVLNGDDGSPVPLSAFAGPYDWAAGTTPDSLSEGGSNRLYYTHDSNVLADDGSALFFTAADTGQLYLRKNPTEDQSPVDSEGNCTNTALACTIQLSKTRKTNGKKPDGTDSAGTQPAVFHAASEDGSKVFFTSTEKLTNDANTGVEPEGSPAIARADLSTEPPTVDMDFLPTKATALDSDEEYIYWVDPSRESIGRATLDGTEPDPDFIAGVHARAIAVDDASLYWTDEHDRGDGTGTIGRAELAPGGAIEPNFIASITRPGGIAADNDHLYWTEDHPGAIIRAEIGNGSGREVFRAVGFPSLSLALSDTELYFASFTNSATNDPDNPGPIAEGCVHRLSLADPGPFTNFACTQPGDGFHTGLAIANNHVYWATRNTNRIGRSGLGGTDVEVDFIPGAGFPTGLTDDGSHLFWSANQGTLPNPGADLYRYDATTDQLTDLTVDPGSENGAEVVGVLGASDDGSRVYFAANGILDEDAGPSGEVASAGDCSDFSNTGQNGTCNLYLSQGGEISFIARLAASDRNWVPGPTANTPGYDPRPSRLTPDGHYLLFTSARQLTDYDNDGIRVLYRYDAADDSLLCVSCNPSGERPTGVPLLTSDMRPSTEVPGPSGSFLSRALSADGNRVFFETTDGLTGDDTDGLGGCPLLGSGEQQRRGIFRSCQDVYMWEAGDTGSCEKQVGCLYLLSPGDDGEPASLAGASVSGDDVFIFTRTQLVGSDRDQLRDVYDLRVGGGLASQYPPPPVICDAADSCKLGPTAPPPTPSPGTAGFQGAGDPPVKRKAKCPKGKVPRGGASKRSSRGGAPQGGASKQSQSDSSAPRAKPQHLAGASQSDSSATGAKTRPVMSDSSAQRAKPKHLSGKGKCVKKKAKRKRGGHHRRTDRGGHR